MHIFKHFLTITRHRHKVLGYCFKSGLYWQGICHDLSKYSRIEFFNGARYYVGTYSPNNNERMHKGYSEAWMHHKGRNKHHCEYWVDADPKDKKYKPVPMPKRYIAENICDRIAATEIYNKKNFHPQMVYDYFMKEKENIPMHQDTSKQIDFLLRLYLEKGKKYLFKYLKKNYRKKEKKS